MAFITQTFQKTLVAIKNDDDAKMGLRLIGLCFFNHRLLRLAQISVVGLISDTPSRVGMGLVCSALKLGGSCSADWEEPVPPEESGKIICLIRSICVLCG